MAYFATKESTLVASTAQTFNLQAVMGGYGAQDRKSTRLNSSHT